MLYQLLSNLIGSLSLYYDCDYTDLPFMAYSYCPYCMDLPFMVDSIDFFSSLWSTVILQVDAAQLTLLAVMLHVIDSFKVTP